MGRFDRVLTSNLPRSCETAVAMGYEIDRSLDELGVIPEALLEATGWPQDIAGIAGRARSHKGLVEFAERQADTWRRALDGLDDRQGGVLIVSHGAIMELGLLASVGWRCVGDPGRVFAYCEGFRLVYEEATCVLGEILRVPEGERLVET